MKCSIATLISALCLFAVPLSAGEDLVFERVFGPELHGRYKHPVSITELDNGDLYMAIYMGAGEYSDDTVICGSRLVKGTTQWTFPRVIADSPYRTDGNAVVWQAPNGLVWLFYVTRYGDSWSDSRIKYKLSQDFGETWSDSEMLSFEKGMMVRAAPIVLNDGDYLLPIYHETGGDREVVGDTSTSLFLRWNEKARTWTETNRVHSPTGNLQPSVVQIDDNYLIAYSRRGGGYEGKEEGWLIRSESRDGGRTWSEGKNSQFLNPNAAADFIKLKNGHLLLVYNNDKIERMPLSVAISTDNDQTYPHRRDIVNEPGNSAAYPFAIQTKDGKIHIVYTSNWRSIIHHVTFDEDAILNYQPAPAK